MPLVMYGTVSQTPSSTTSINLSQLAGVWTTIGTIGVALAIFIVDRVGRRIMLGKSLFA